MLLVSALHFVSGNATMCQCGMSDAKGMCAQEMERIIDASILGVSFGNEGRVV
jgi:CDGSH-type Zn-finger protein